MNLKEYLSIISRRKWVIIVTTLATVVVAVIGTLLITPKYEATATLRVATALVGSLDYVSYDTTYADRLMNTYAKIVTSAPMRAELEKKLGLKDATIRVDTSAKSELMQITVENPNPALAAQAANALSDLLIAYVKSNDTTGGKTSQQMISEQLAQAENELQQARRDYASLVAAPVPTPEAVAAASRLLGVKEETYASLLSLYERVRMIQTMRDIPLSVIEPAAIPEVPSQPRKELNILVGLMVGLLAGSGMAFLLESLDNTLYTTEQIEQATQRAILGKIPPLKTMNTLFVNGHSPGGEAFRQVRTSLLNFDGKAPLRTVLVTSAEKAEGKSTIAANLAYALKQSGRKVLLIDCDLRLPTLHRMFDLPNEFGLSDVLSEKKRLDQVVQCNPKTEVQVVTSGTPPPNPAELLGSAQMAAVIEQATQEFDIVMLDSPSLLAVTDPIVLASKVDAVLLVVARARIGENAVKAACRLLESAKARSVGIVVNRTEPNGTYNYYLKQS